MTMRMFYFVADYFPAWRYDVIELFGHELPKRGLDVTWCMRRADAGSCVKTCQEGQVVYLPLALDRSSRVRRLFNCPLEAICEAWWFLSVLLPNRYDVIQVRDDRYLAGFWSWIAARLTGAKFVYWLSFPFPENYAEKAKRISGAGGLLLDARARLTAWWLYRVVLPRADFVFVQSEAMRADLECYGIPRERMMPVPMGVPERLLTSAMQRHDQAVPGRVVYIGTLAAVRRLEIIIDAFALVLKRCPHAELFMVGDGDVPDEREALERRATQLGIADVVRFTGFVPIEKAWGILGSAAIGLSPFYVDRVLRVASPTKLVEYMAMSRPTVCNDHPEQSVVIRESGAGLCVAWSPESFANAIIELLEDPAKAATLGGKGPGWVRQHRTYGSIADAVWYRYAALLRETV